MALKRLRTEEMVAISKSWVDPEHPDRLALGAVPALATLLPELDAACAGLHATYRAGPGTARRQQLQDRQRELDLEHDDVLRGIWFYLQSQVLITREPAARSELERLRERLLPEGLLAVNKSYREQAGQAALAAQQLTERDRERLAQMPMHDGRTLLDLVERWLALGAEIGALDRARAGDLRDNVPRPAEALAARNRWIRTVNTMREVAALVAAQAPAIQAILARVEVAEREAERRAAGRDPAGDAPEHPDGTEADDEDAREPAPLAHDPARSPDGSLS
jgi:hypothetical protein